MRSATNALPDLLRVALVVLPPDCWPMLVERSCGFTVLWMDPRATRKTLTDAMVLSLTSDELAQARQAYGQVPVGALEDWTQEEVPALLWVPPSLRIRGAPALQGGAELERRQRLGLMAFEIACMRAQCITLPQARDRRTYPRTAVRPGQF